MNLKRGTEVEEPYLQNWEKSPQKSQARSTEAQTRLSPGSASLSARLLRGLGRAHAGDAAREESGRVSSGKHFSLTFPTMVQSPQPVGCSEHAESGDGAVPTGSPSELPNLPKPNQNKAASSPTGAKRACQRRWSVHTLLHKSSRQRPVHTAADSETSPGSGRRAGAAPPSPGLDCR